MLIGTVISRISSIGRTLGSLRRVHRGGGPKRIRLARVGHPRGLVLTSSQAVVEVETRSGEVVRVSPELPVPFLYAWAYRLARRLGVPFVASLEPEDISFELGVPVRLWGPSRA